MKRAFHGLFWKIFAGFLFANILVMTITTYHVMHISDSDNMRKRYKEVGSNIAEIIIHQYESGRDINFKQIQRATKKHTPFVKLIILDRNNKIVFGHRHRNINDELINMTIQSANGNPYLVKISYPLVPQKLKNFFKRLQSTRSVLLLIASIFVSFVLSLLISRPLKQLGEHARSLADGNMQSRVEDRLLSRRDEIGDLSREFNNMANQLDALITSKQQLLHDVSHELRAPLARLQATAAIAQQNTQDASLERIDKECQRMDDLIHEILRYSRIQEHEYKHEQIQLGELVKGLVADVQYEYSDHPIRMLRFDEDVQFKGNPDTLASAVENILRNACKHTVEQTQIDISLYQQDQHIHIVVRDHGLGVPNNELSELTAPFYRASNQDRSGFGLGLSIAKRAIKQHQGTLDIRNHSDGGLELEVQLPTNS